jgi:DNA-binding winged helix-turn-helix (wHTH) protein/TolB-like protein/Flp pilus assembly protein TadD
MSGNYFEFGAFQFDAARQTLTRDGSTAQLKGKASELLQVLVEHSGEVLDKDQLMKFLWPDTVVEENNLTVHMTALRKALGDSPNEQRYIATIPGRGYRFVADVRQPARDAQIIIAERTRASLMIEECDANGLDDAASMRPADQPLSPMPLLLERRRTRGWAIAVAAMLIALVGAAAVYLRLRKPDHAVPRSTSKTIAVLPFKVMSAEPDEYLGMGLADALITRLGNLSQVVVRPTSMVRKYSGVETDPVEAGQALKVDAVLEGSIQRLKEQIRVTVQLVNVTDGTHLWTAKFDEQFTQLFAVEDSISQRLTEALSLALSGGEKERLRHHYTENSQAYQLYLRGRYYIDSLTKEGFKKSFEYLNQALAADPKYALAWDGLAYYHINTVDLIASPREAFPLAREAAEKALAIDNALAEAHTSLAMIEWQYDWNFASAEQEFRRAIDLKPSSGFTHHNYGFFLALMGRFDEAIAESLRAQELAPRTYETSLGVMQNHYYARRYDEAIEYGREFIRENPNHWLSHTLLGRAYETSGRLDKAISEYELASRLDETAPEVLMDLGRAYGLAGKKTEAERVLADLRGQAAGSYAAPFQLAMVHAGLGDNDQAFAQLEKAYRDRSWYMTWLKAVPVLDVLRPDPRFGELSRRVGFAQ